MRVYNFSSGPAMMPLEVLQRAAAELTDWNGSGMSVMEVSHRGKDFVACAARAEESLRRVLGIPGNYRVLFIQGGATAQFSFVPLNLTAEGDTVAYLHTGQWSAKAIAAAKTQRVNVVLAADEAASSYTTVPAPGSIVVDPSAHYLHYTPNETIGGVEFGYVPQVGVPLVADMSSTILSRPIDVSQYGLIYAGAQKNMGPAGLCVVIVRDDLVGHARPETPSIFDYQAMADADSMVNTPPTFSIYLLGLILDWIEEMGGLSAMAARNKAKAEALYAALDASSGFYTNKVAPECRSWMNVTFTLPDPALDKDFVAGADAAGLTNLKGHRSVGGMRASLYNAMPLDGVEALIAYLADFQKKAVIR